LSVEKLTVRKEDSEIDRKINKRKVIDFYAVVDFPEPNRSVPTGGEKALTVR